MRVSCLGDSHTRGEVGAPWLPALQKRLGVPCDNYGRDGETAGAIALRARQLAPTEYAVVLAGTNDALLELVTRTGNAAMLRAYRRQSSLPDDYRPSVTAFGAAFRSLLKAVPARWVVAASLPPVGEATEGEAVDVVEAYNVEIRAAVEEAPKTVYAAFGEALRPRLPPPGRGQPFDASAAGFNSAVRDMLLHRALHAVPFGPSLGSLAWLRGRRVLHDQIHLTESSSAALVEVIAGAFAEVRRMRSG